MQKIQVVFNIIILCLLIGVLSFTFMSINNSVLSFNNQVEAYAESEPDKEESESQNQDINSADIRGWISIGISIIALIGTILNIVFLFKKSLKDNKKEFRNNKRMLIDELCKFKDGLKKPITNTTPITCRFDGDFPYDTIVEIIENSKIFTTIKTEFENFCDMVDLFFSGGEEETNVIIECNNLCDKIRKLSYTKSYNKRSVA